MLNTYNEEKKMTYEIAQLVIFPEYSFDNFIGFVLIGSSFLALDVDIEIALYIQTVSH